jgi:signal transduction histidine kinase
MKKLLLLVGLWAQTGFAQPHQIDSLKQALSSLDKQPNSYTKDTLRFNTLKSIMSAYAEVRIDSSVYYNRLMIQLCGDQKLQKELVYAYQYAGYLYQIKDDYRKSIWFHYKALALAEKLKEYTRMARSLGALAHAYTGFKDYKDYPKILNFCQQGLALLRKYPDTTIQLSILNVKGTIYREQGKLTDALNVNQDMYKLAQTEHIQWYEAQSLQAIGWAYKEMGDMTKALDYTKRALDVCCEKRHEDLKGRVDLKANILANIADVYIRQKKWQQALVYCKQAKLIADSTNNSRVLAESEEQLYKIFKNTGEPTKALNAYENFVFLKDSLSKVTNEQGIEMLQAQYDNVKKTNELQKERVQRLAGENKNLQLAKARNWLFTGIIAALLVAVSLSWNNRRLQVKNREIGRQRVLLQTAGRQLADINKTLETRVEERTAELINLNRELIQTNEKIKEALFKGQTIERKRVALELHDNLSSLLSAVNMSIQLINPQNLSESEQSVYRNVKQLIQNAYAEVRNISHNILPAELDREGLAATLTTLVGQLNQSSPLQFSLTITGLQERLPVEIEFNAYSIVFELINNVIKHAKATNVGISLLRTNLGIDISVTDDGIGLGQQNTKRGVGLQNIQTRLESLDGTFTTLLPTEKGTRILIKIPIETVRFNGNGRMA